MSTEFDPRRNIPPPEGAELTHEEAFEQEIAGYLKDVELEDPRVQAFFDHTDWINASLDRSINSNSGLIVKYNPDLVMEEIRQKRNGVRGYKAAHDEIIKITGGYWRRLKEQYGDMAEQYYPEDLMEIKDQEIDRKSKQFLTLPKQ